MGKHTKIYLILACISIIALILRVQTYFSLNAAAFPQVLSPDPWYTIRQIDLASHTWFSYAWFDPFTSYPGGGVHYWGPLLAFIGSLLALITGTAHSSALIPIVSWIPVITAVLSIPLVYALGRHLDGELCGLCAAILIALIPGSYLIRSMYGYVDHHILESFFMLAYACALIWAWTRLSTPHANTSPMKTAVIGGIGTGLVLGLGMMNAPTMIIAAGITTLFVIGIISKAIQMRQDISPILLFISLVSGIGALITIGGYPSDPTGHIPVIFHSLFLASVLLLPALVALYLGILQHAFKRAHISETWILPALAGTIVGVYGIATMLSPELIISLQHKIASIPASTSTSYTIGEYLPLSPDIALFNYHLMLILLIPGLILLLHHGIRKHNPFALYLFFWTATTGVLTVLNTRYEILFAVPLTLTFASLISWLFTYNTNIPESSCDHPRWHERPTALVAVMLFLGTCAASLCVSGMVATADYNYQPYIASEDWIEGLLWMRNATPDPGVEYYTVYDAKSFSYPETAYKVLSWWDYGHWITTLAHRIAVTNPFQANVEMAAQFFMNRDESAADTIATTDHIRYIITDADMLFGTMQMMMKVYSTNATLDQYLGLMPDASIGYRQPFYESMVTRLHVFDSSEAKGGQQSNKEEGTLIPGTDLLAIFPGNTDPGVSDSIIRPLKDIDALRHYRLIWESNTSLSTTSEHDIRKVKIFERVPGAVIHGTGTIEIPMITNRGREYTYRQKSVNGTFIVPYSTNKTAWPVHATGPYRIVETGEEIEISEEMVMGGEK